MKKYKLKKDLFFLPKETDVKILSAGCVPLCLFKDEIHIRTDYVDFFITGGWIEEVKPREFIIQVYDDNVVTQEFRPYKTETIKVREVIE